MVPAAAAAAAAAIVVVVGTSARLTAFRVVEWFTVAPFAFIGS